MSSTRRQFLRDAACLGAGLAFADQAGGFAGTRPGDDVPAYWITFGDAERFSAEMTQRALASGSLPATWRCGELQRESSRAGG